MIQKVGLQKPRPHSNLLSLSLYIYIYRNLTGLVHVFVQKQIGRAAAGSYQSSTEPPHLSLLLRCLLAL